MRAAAFALFTGATFVSCDRGALRARQRSGGTSAALASLVALGDSQVTRSEYDSARITLEKAISGAGALGDSAAISRAWTSLSILARHSGSLDEAASLGERAVALKRRLGLVAELARSLNALGTLANDRGNYDVAVMRLREAREAAEAVHDSVYVGRARGNLGLAYAYMGDLDRARSELLAFRDFAATTHRTRDEGDALDNLGLVETRAGDPVAAIAWLDSARSRYALISYAVGEENALGQLGIAWQELGENARALAYFDSAHALATKKGLLEPEADDLGLIAELYEDAGDHRSALEALGRARRLADSLKLQSKLGQFLFTEARAYASLGMPGLALARANEAASREQAADSPIDELGARLEAAEVSQRLGDAAGATRSLARARALAGKLSSGIARIQFALGAARVADAAKRSDDVLVQLGATTDTALLTAGERSEAEALRARAMFRKRDYDGAAAAGRRAVEAVERLSRQVGSPALRTSYMADRARTYADLVITLLAQKRVDDAFRVADAARGRALIDQLSAARRELPRGGAAGDLATADSLLRRINALVEQLRIADTTHPAHSDRGPSTAASPAAEAVLRDLSLARVSYDSLAVRTGRPESRGAIVGASAVDIAAIKRSLAPDERLVEYFAARDRLLIFVLSRESTSVVEVPIADSAVAEQARLARDLIAGRRATNAPASALYASLIRPLEKRDLLTGARGLVLVPHGALTYLPFAALRDSPGSPYLAERFSIITLTSASALVPLRQTTTATTGAAQVFAPLTKELPASRDEADAVAHMLTGTATLDADASETAVRRALRVASIVHVASHGTLDADRPMFSAVALALPRKTTAPDNDGRLETHEVMALDVRSRLVYLSGCETALGGSGPTSFHKGEDYTTLAQAFLFAGAKNVVATLWRIDDRGATEFATRFYRELSTSSPANALAAAQRAMIRDPRYAAPYYWAAYTVSGAGTIQ